MGLLAWIIFGALAGWIASLIMKADDQIGLVGNILLGIAGALIGGFLAGVLGVGEDHVDFDLGSLLLAIGGACLLIWAVRAMRGGPTRRI